MAASTKRMWMKAGELDELFSALKRRPTSQMMPGIDEIMTEQDDVVNCRPARAAAWKTFAANQNLKSEIVREMFDDTVELASRIGKSSGPSSEKQICFTWEWQMYLANTTKRSNEVFPNVVLDDAQALLVTLATAVLRVFESAVALEKLKTPEVVAATQTQMPPEHSPTMLCYGGGALGEMARTNGSLVRGRTTSDVARRNSRQMLELISKVKMSADEKKAHLPMHLQKRDRGGMYFPKMCFLPAIRHVVEEVRAKAVGPNIEKYGSSIAKVACTELLYCKDALEKFNAALKFVYDCRQEPVPTISRVFVQTWIRKLVHARFNESLVGYQQLAQEDEGRLLAKGGHTLRDQLYEAATTAWARKKVKTAQAKPLTKPSTSRSSQLVQAAQAKPRIKQKTASLLQRHIRTNHVAERALLVTRSSRTVKPRRMLDL